MYIWLEEKDFQKQIKADILDRIVQNDTSIILDAERAAIVELQGMLRIKYDVAAIFSQAGTQRNALVVMLLVDILLYHVHSRLNANQIPDIRKERYDNAIATLKDLGAGKMDIGLPLIINAEGETQSPAGMSYQGELKRPNRF